MRHIRGVVRTTAFGALTAALLLQAAETRTATRVATTQSLQPRIIRAEAFGLSPRIADLPPPAPISGEPARPPEFAVTLHPGDGVDGALQSAVLPSLMPAPIVSFDGLSQADNVAALLPSTWPPDPAGDIGPNHYVQQTNSLIRVFDRAGAPLTLPFTLNGLFASLPTPCATGHTLAPVTLYDSLADRWLLIGKVPVGVSQGRLCIAISQGPDPTSAYHRYTFLLDQFEGTGLARIGVWPDGYYAAMDAFNDVQLAGTLVLALDRVPMLDGQPMEAVAFTLTSETPKMWGLHPSDFDGHVAPPPGAPNTFAMLTANEFGRPADGLRLFDFHADFSTPTNSTFIERPETSLATPLAVAAFDPTNPASNQDIPQPPPTTQTEALDSVTEVLMVRLQYRNSGTAESLVLAHTVGAPASPTYGIYRAGVRYYQLARPIGGTYSVVEQATFAPADGVNRWIGSAALDHQGNLAVGYSAASLSTFPSLRYAGRLATDLSGGLFQGEGSLVAGGGAQTHFSSGWGRTTVMSVDPLDDCTFWFTGPYYAASGDSWNTRIGAFKFADCIPKPTGTLQGIVRHASTNAGIAGVLITLSNGFGTTSLGTGAYTRSTTPGTYTVTVSKPGFATQVFNGVAIVGGQITLLDVLLQPVAVLAPDGQLLVAESLLPTNGVIDPGEDVTVALTLRNDGAVASTNLIATPRATAQVLQPSGPVSYGAIAPAASATRQFSFRATPTGACGAPVVVILDLTDGAFSLGAVSFRFAPGQPSHQCPPGSGNFVRNPGFTLGADGSDHWTKFALPDPSGMTWNVTGGVFQFYRTGTQAVVFQPTGVPVPAGMSLEAAFSLGNTTTVRKRLSVLIHDLDFTDLFVCTFWIPPNTPFASYLMRTHTTKAWTNATISFYAANIGNEGNGFYRLDNIQFYTGLHAPTRTDCLAPFPPPDGTPAPIKVNLLANGGFGSGTLPPWTLFGQIVGQIGGGVFEFYRPPGTPAGVILQSTTQVVAQAQPMLATFDLGNSSAVRKRVTVLLHDNDFSDLGACTFWLEPGAPLAPFTMRFVATKPWANATVSFYPATIGTQQWIRLDNVAFMADFSAIASTECIEPGG